ncbi:hypothetical protein [Methylomonas sp. DH-1]|uniref:hypothetical protein n=1 Tax=Methylomonas sp. (strain DH-1) TaxID=1727196 RepID=UPI0012F6A871|nr:hypothetical protein [Methylomonas sp. DH-1]
MHPRIALTDGLVRPNFPVLGAVKGDTPQKRVKYFVFVIDPPSPVDLYHRRSEGKIIKQAANLNRISCSAKTTINYEYFEAALKICLKEEMEANHDLIPILYISAHGFSYGIQLSSDQILT